MGFIVKAVKSVVKAVVGIVSKVVGGVFGFAVGGGTKKAAAVNTLNKSLDPEAYRKIVFGLTAAPLDQRYWEVWGPKGTKFDEVIAIATHRINSLKELYFEDKLGINAAGAAQGEFVGVVTRQYTPGNGGTVPAGAGAQWTANATFDGCAHMVLHWTPDEKKLPNGIPNRYTQIVEGAFLYDPRRDSTVVGGSGSHRINDQSTWAYATLDSNGQPIGRNNALQVLWYLIGWRIPKKNAGGALTGELELVAGRGVDPEDINLATFMAAANACEAAGYYTDLALSTEDSHTSNEDKLTCNGLIGQLIDPGGLWSYYANVDDTANIAVELTDVDIIEGPVSWNEYKGMSEQYTGVGGKFVNPSATTLFQAFPYPMVRDAVYEGNLGVKRRKTQDFEQILDSTLAQRLARLLLNQSQYQGEFGAQFNYRALRAQAWSIVRYTSERYGFVKLFRVWRYDLSTEQGIGMLLKEVHASIWTAGTVTAPLAPGVGLKYNPAQEVAAEGVVVALYPMVGANGDKGDGFKISWTLPPENVRRTEIRYRLVGTAAWLTAGPVARDVVEVIAGPLLSGAIYEVQVRHISIHEVTGPWVFPTAAPANGAGQFQLGVTGTVNYAAIAAAGGTAVWANVTGPGRPEDNADITLTHIATGVVGQAPAATDLTIQPSATNDRIPDARSTNQPPSWYRTNYAFRSIIEFKDGFVLGVPGAAAADYYGSLQTITDWTDNSGGLVKQRFVYGANISSLAGQTYIRVGNTAGTGWQAWQRDFSGFLRPSFNSGDLVDSLGTVTQLGYRTIEGLSSGYVGQTAWGTELTPPSSVLRPQANLIYDGGFRLGGHGWTRNNWAVNRDGRGPYMICFAAGDYLVSQVAQCHASIPYTISFEFETNRNDCRGGLIFLNAAFATIGEVSVSVPSGSSGRVSGTGTSPVGTVWMQAFGYSGTGGTYAVIWKVKAELGAALTPFNDNTTSGALYLTGVTMDSLQPQEINSNNTETRISYGFTGQAPIATDIDAIARIIAMRGDNLARNSMFIEGNVQWTFGDGASYGALPAGSPAPGGATFPYSAANAAFVFANNGAEIPVASRVVFISGLFENNAGGSVNMRFACECHDGDGTLRYVTVDWTLPYPSTWALFVYRLILPNTVATIKPYIQRLQAGAAASVRGTAFRMAFAQAGADITIDQPIVSRLNPTTGRVTDPQMYNTQLILGPDNTTTVAPTYTVGGSNVTVNIPAHSRVVAGPSGPVTLSYGAASATWPFSSGWFAYTDDANMAGIASPTITLTANANDLLYPGRYHIASGVTPAAGGGGGSTGGGGGSGGGGYLGGGGGGQIP